MKKGFSKGEKLGLGHDCSRLFFHNGTSADKRRLGQ